MLEQKCLCKVRKPSDILNSCRSWITQNKILHTHNQRARPTNQIRHLRNKKRNHKDHPRKHKHKQRKITDCYRQRSAFDSLFQSKHNPLNRKCNDQRWKDQINQLQCLIKSISEHHHYRTYQPKSQSRFEREIEQSRRRWGNRTSFLFFSVRSFWSGSIFY